MEIFGYFYIVDMLDSQKSSCFFNCRVTDGVTVKKKYLEESNIEMAKYLNDPPSYQRYHRDIYKSAGIDIMELSKENCFCNVPV